MTPNPIQDGEGQEVGGGKTWPQDSPPPETPGQRAFWHCRACGRVGESANDLLRQGCEGKHEQFVPLSDTNHLRERAERAEAEVNSLWESLQEEGAAVERVREWAEAVRDRPCGDEDFDHGVRNAGRHVLNLLNTEESK